jgi:large subunit ribosomal protein L18
VERKGQGRREAIMPKSTLDARKRRKRRIRKKIHGTSVRPRLTVFRSAKHTYAQVVDDSQGSTLVAISTLSPKLAEELKELPKRKAAKKVGETIGRMCLEKGIEKVVFDRNGYLYHGRVAALASGAREAGLRV